MDLWDKLFKLSASENDLGTKRVNTLLVTSAGIFAGFGIVALELVFDSQIPTLGVPICFIIASVGIFFSYLMRNRLKQGSEQLERLHELGEELPEVRRGQVPNPVGINVRRKGQGFETLGTKELPIVIIVAWAALLAVVLGQL